VVTGVRLAAVASAVPPAAMDQDDLWADYFEAAYGGDRRAARLWRSTGVRTRYGVIDPRVEDVATWTTGERMRRFAAEAAPLAKQAVADALGKAGVPAADVGLFAVASCTGYSTPGLDITVSRDLGMPNTVRRLAIGHMGCYAALPGVAAVADYVRASGRPGVLLCCELTSLHLQPAAWPGPDGRLTGAELEQLVTHALFADAAAAVVLLPGAGGLQVVDVQARTDPDTSGYMMWDITDTGFRMGLSPRVPDVLAAHVGPAMTDLLGGQDLSVPDVAAWAIHPGGPRVVDAVADTLGLEPGSTEPSYDVLARYGNCSSATVLLVLQEILARRRPGPGEPLVMLAFGPGLTLYSALLRQG
jgi:predicted naringenin-chalcone synthase